MCMYISVHTCTCVSAYVYYTHTHRPGQGERPAHERDIGRVKKVFRHVRVRANWKLGGAGKVHAAQKHPAPIRMY